MISTIGASYSGVVVGVDAGGEEKSLIPSSLHLETKPKILGKHWHYQTFRLPEDYARGTDEGEKNYPALSGFQLLVEVSTGKAKEAELEFTLERYFFGSGWSKLTEGTFRGCHTDGERVWMDVIFEQTVTVDETMVPALLEANPSTDTLLRIGFHNKANVNKVWYTEPNPYAHGEGTEEDGLATDFSFNFRVLGLVADSGYDFLGNPYRSAAVTAKSTNPSGENNNTGYWLSSPQPSEFAVVSHYSDVRPFPTTPSYVAFNYVIDPSFEHDKLGTGVRFWNLKDSYWTTGESSVTVIASRGLWDENETYERYEGVEYNGHTYISEVVENLGHNPESDFEVHWKKAVVAEAPEGHNYLEVSAKPHSESETPPFEGKASPFKQKLKATLLFEGTVNGRATHAGPGIYISTISVYQAQPITFSIWVRSKTGTFKMAIGFGDTRVGKAEHEFEATEKWKRQEVTLTPTAAGETTIAVWSRSSETKTFLVDAAMVNRGSKAGSYIDGDKVDCVWTNAKGFSISAELSEKEVEEDAVVIDGVLVDPITPGVAFSIYYSSDLVGSEDGEPTIEQWEKKLWTRVPATYVTTVKQTYTLPEPIVAKFVKIEFSHLQAQSYDPGDVQNSVVYKRFPEWVVKPFVAALKLPSLTARRVGVSFDALELAYSYVLEDLQRTPESPKKGRKAKGKAANQVDPHTLRKINTNTKEFTVSPASRAKRDTLLGITESIISAKSENYPVEEIPGFIGSANFPVSGLQRQNILIDQSMPVLYFFVTCRHEYQELAGVFDHKRAYFAGLNEIAFIRHVYTRPSDTEMYVESGGDTLNAERNDFVLEGLDWFVY